MKKAQLRLVVNFSLALVVAFFVFLLLQNGYLTKTQSKIADRLFLKQNITGDVVIVAIDDKSIQSLGQWPWPRKIIAKLVSEISKQNPKAIGLDINFAEPSRFGADDDKALADALSNSKVVLPVEATALEKLKLGSEIFLRANGILQPLAIFSKNSVGLGHVNVFPDDDGVVRQLPTEFQWDSKNIKAFSREIIQQANVQPAKPLPSSVLLNINFFGPPQTFKYVPASDVLDGKGDSQSLKDKIVLVGATSQDLHDAQMVPTSKGIPMPGVEIHANAIETILQGKFLQDLDKNWTIALIFILALINALCISYFKKLYQVVLVAFAVLVAYNISGLIAFEQGTIFNLVHPNLSFVFSFLGLILYQYFAEGKEKAFLRQSFQQYLAPAVVEQIIANPDNLKLGGQKRELTVLFSDIRGFTTISEKTSPEELVAFLNRYFTAMANIILAEQGVVDKFIGDAIMAFWGAPQELKNHAEQACRSALKMKAELVDFKDEWKAKGVDFNIGIGINTGEMLVGNMGSSQRFDYTVIGDNVNVASRLEGLNKEFKTNIIISESTYKSVKEIPEFHFNFLGDAMVKGKTKPVKIFELF